MSGNKFLLDTNAVLYILNGDTTLSDFTFEKELYISIITEMELLAYKNITPSEKRILENFLEELIIINIDNKVKSNAIEVKKTSNMKLPDSVIAGTAITLKLPLITSDRQFKTIEGLDLIYYEK
jgi:predicted nucleic acid-binding protein